MWVLPKTFLKTVRVRRNVSAALPYSAIAAEDQAKASEAAEVRVLYLTNRDRSDTNDPAQRYGVGRGDPQFGICAVEFSPLPLMDDMADRVPFYVKRETATLRRAEPLDAREFCPDNKLFVAVQDIDAEAALQIDRYASSCFGGARWFSKDAGRLLGGRR